MQIFLLQFHLGVFCIQVFPGSNTGGSYGVFNQCSLNKSFKYPSWVKFIHLGNSTGVDGTKLFEIFKIKIYFFDNLLVQYNDLQEIYPFY